MPFTFFTPFCEMLSNWFKGEKHTLAVEELIYKCLSLYIPLLVSGKSVKPSHEITSIKGSIKFKCVIKE
jgi:hypothetical protein